MMKRSPPLPPKAKKGKRTRSLLLKAEKARRTRPLLPKAEKMKRTRPPLPKAKKGKQTLLRLLKVIPMLPPQVKTYRPPTFPLKVKPEKTSLSLRCR
jgi:hypothetical protein